MFTRLSSRYSRPSTSPRIPSVFIRGLSRSICGRVGSLRPDGGPGRSIGGPVQRLHPGRRPSRGSVLPRGRRVQGAARRHARERAGRGVGAFPFRACRVEAGCAERVVRAEHTADGGHAWRGQPDGRRAGRRDHPLARDRTGLLPPALQCEQHGEGGGRLRGLRHPRAEAAVRRLRRSGEGPDCPDPGARAGRARSEEPVRRRRHRGGGGRDQEGAGGASEGRRRRLFVTDVHNHPAAQNFEASARAFWPPEPPRIDRFTLASWGDRVRIPVGQISPALAETLVRGTGSR